MTEETEEEYSSSLSDPVKALIADRIINPTRNHGTIYYIACPETKRVKIGFTKSAPEARLRALQTGSPTELRLMVVHPGSIDDERYLHGEFDENRIHGEWFEMDDVVFECMAYICWATAVVAKHKGAETPHWALTGLEAMEKHWGPMPIDLGVRRQ